MKVFDIASRFLLITSYFAITSAYAKPKEASIKLTMHCETKSVFFSYPNNNSYIKDLYSHSRELYSEKFLIDFLSSDKALKKQANDIIEDVDYSVIKTGSLYKLKSIKGTDDISVVIDLKSGKYSSISEKHDAMIRIKATGTCVRN